MSRAGWILVALSAALSAQEQPDPNANFTGTATRLESNIHVQAARIHFESGARTKWHVHERGQILLCEEGVARTQVQGHPVQVLHPGDTAYVPGGVPHWHGAAAGQSATLFSVDLNAGTPLDRSRVDVAGNNCSLAEEKWAGQTKWLDAVTEAEYKADQKR